MSDRIGTNHGPRMALDWGGWRNSLDPHQGYEIDEQMRDAPDKPAEQRHLTHLVFLSERTGIPLQDVEDHMSDVMAGYAAMNDWGDAWQDPAKFHAKIVETATFEQERSVMHRGKEGDTEEAKATQAASLRHHAYDAGSEGKPIGTEFPKWQKGAKAGKGYKAGLAWEDLTEFSALHEAGKADLAAGRKAAEAVLPILQKLEIVGDDSNPYDAAPHIRDLTPRQMRIMQREIGRMSGKMKSYPAKGNALAEIGKGLLSFGEEDLDKVEYAGGRSLFNIGSQIWEGIEVSKYDSLKFKEGQEVPMAYIDAGVENLVNRRVSEREDVTVEGVPMRELTKAQADEANAIVQRKLTDATNLRKLRLIAQGTVLPVEADSMLGAGLQGVAESFPIMGLAWAGPAGQALLATSYTADAQARLVEDGVPQDKAQILAPVIGMAQAMVDRTQAQWLVKNPLVKAAMGKWGAKPFATGTARVALTTAFEIGAEQVQDFTPKMVQDFGAAIFGDVPGTPDEEVLELIWKSSQQMIPSMLLMSGVAGGAATWRDVKGLQAIAQQNPEALARLGYQPDHIAAITGAKDDADTQAQLRAFWPQRVVTEEMKGKSPAEAVGQLSQPLPLPKGFPAETPAGTETTEGGVDGEYDAALEAKDAAEMTVAEARQNHREGKISEEEYQAAEADYGKAVDASMAARRAYEKRLETSAAAKETEPETDEVSTSTPLRRDDTTWYLLRADGTRTDVGTVEAGLHLQRALAMAESEKQAAGYISVLDALHKPGQVTTITGEAVTVERGGQTSTMTPGGEFLEGAKPADAVAELNRELELMGVESGSIEGSNFIRDGVQQIVLNKSAKGAMTALHENVEALYKAGKLSPEEVKMAGHIGFMLYENVKGGEETALRLQRISLGKSNPTEARETLVELFVANEVSRRKDASNSPLPAGALTAALLGDAKTRRAMPRMTAFFRAVRAYIKGVFSTAARIAKARKGGDMDIEALDQMTDKLLGLDPRRVEAQERQHERDMEAAARETFEVNEKETFSLGPAGLMEQLAGEIAAKITDPKEKLQAYTRAHEKFLGMARAIRHNDDVAEAVTKAAIEKERIQRKAARQEELFQEIEKDFGDLFGTEFMAAAMNNPVMDAIFTKKPGDKFPRSRIRSESAALKSGRDTAGDYDGAQELPAWVFGGQSNPDQIAQELADEGLIKDAYPDTLWNAIEKALKSAGAAKARLKEHAERRRDAREQAATEAQEWASGEIAALPKRKGERETRDLQRFMAALDSLLVVLPPEVRAKAGGFAHSQLAQIQTNKARAEFIGKKIDKIDTVFEKFLRKEYSERMATLVDRANKKATEAGKKPGSTIGPDAHYLINQAAAAMRMNETEANAELAKIDSRIASGELTPEQEALAMRERELVNLAGDWKNNDAAQMAAAYEAAENTFDEGWLEWSRKVVAKREAREAWRQKFGDDTGKSGDPEEIDASQSRDRKPLGRVKDWLVGISSYRELFELAFGRGSAAAREFANREMDASNQKEDEIQEAADAMDDLFTELAGGRFKGTELHHELSQPKFDTGKVAGMVSELEGVTYSLTWAQEDGRRHMESEGWTQELVTMIEDGLSQDAKAVQSWLRGRYDAQHPTLNPLYRERHGVNLPQHDNYAPLAVRPLNEREGTMADPFTGQSVSSGSLLTPGSLRSRSRNAKAKVRKIDATQVYLAQVRQLAHWKAYYDLAIDMAAVFGNRELGDKIRAGAGEQALSAIRGWSEFIAQGGVRDAAAFIALNQTLNRMASRGAQMLLFGKAGTLAIQATQLGAALVEMPTAAYMLRLTKLLSGNLKWTDAINSPYIQRRIASEIPIVRQAMQGLAATEPRKIKYAARQLGRLLNGTDAMFTAGTYAILLDYHRKQGKAAGLEGVELEAYAHREAEIGTDRVAQPLRSGARSLYENTLTNPLARVGFNFASDSRNKLSVAAHAAYHAKKEPARLARALTLFWGVSGLMASVIRAAMRDRADDDDEWTKELGPLGFLDKKNWNPWRLAMQTFAGPLQGLPVIGDAIEAGAAGLAGQPVLEGTVFGKVGEGGRHVKKLATGKTFESEEPTEDTLKALKGILVSLGFMNDTIAAAATVSNVAEEALKTVDNLEGTDK